jgi:hypothetical protein
MKSPYLIGNLIEALEKLKHEENNNEAKDELTEAILTLIFKIELNQIIPTYHQKSRIGPLIRSALDSIGMVMDTTIMDFPNKTYEKSCILRSGLQFLFDNYYHYFISPEQEHARNRLASFQEDRQLFRFDMAVDTYQAKYPQTRIDVSTITTRLQHIITATKHHWWK